MAKFTNNTNEVIEKLQKEALTLYQNGRLAEARNICERILKISPKNVLALELSGITCLIERRFDDAVAFYSNLIRINPKIPSAYLNRGIALKALGKIDLAIQNYDAAIVLNPKDARSYYNRANSLIQLKKYEDAIGSYNKAINLNPKYAEAYTNLAGALLEKMHYQDAVQNLYKAISIDPKNGDALYNLGKALHKLNKYEEAIDSFDRAIALTNSHFEAINDKGLVLHDLKRYEESLNHFKRAILINPGYAEAYSNRGNTLKELKRFHEALASFDKAIELQPDLGEAHNNRGNTLKELKRFHEALASYDKAIELKPDLGEAYSNRGNTLKELKRFHEALVSYDKAIELKPSIDFLAGNRLHTKMIVCNWRNLDQEVQELRIQIEKSNTASSPFSLLGLVDSAPLQRKCAEIYTNEKYPSLQRGLAPTVTSRKHRITIGYFSGDFHNHATAYLMAELFERHDHDRFRVIAFSFGPNSKSEMRERMQPHFEAFHDVRLMSDNEIVGLSRQEDVDIAVDLKGFTQDAQTDIFASRVAPIQVNYLGYPGTMAADYIDYIIADPTLIPLEYQEHYSEKVVYLPHSYQPNDRKREIAQKNFPRAELGLPKDGFVYCCFNNNWKITPDVFDLWMNILKGIPTSVLWLLEDNKYVAENLRQEAQIRGVKPHRLVFAGRMPLAQHLARHKCADLFLDTLPCNAHTTSSDALWAGLPVLTRMGESFASRVAASLLNAIGLPEMITTSAIEYERMAIDLAQNPAKLVSIKRKLSENRLTMPLFDTELYAKHLEAAYIDMHERYRSGLPAAHIRIKP